jgi:phospholipid N-methyltransferase
MITNDLPLDTLNKFMPAINAVTSADVTAFAAKYFDTPLSLIIIGKAADFLEPLKKSFPEVKVIKVPEMDLNRADLTKAKP